MKTDKWILKNTSSLSGKTVAISGSTGGLGRELCRYFAMLGASLILVDRNTDKSLGVANELKSEFPELTVSCIKADMSDIESVKLAEKSLSQMNVDFLVLNAGAYSIPRYNRYRIRQRFYDKFHLPLLPCKEAFAGYRRKGREDSCRKQYCP